MYISLGNHSKRPISQILTKIPKDSKSLIFKIKRQTKLFLKSNLKPKINNISCENKKSCFSDSEDKENSFFEKVKKRQGKKLNYNPFIYNYIKKNSKHFYSMLREEYNEQCNAILKKISLEFRINEYKKNSIVFRYGDSSLRYYLIFKGSVEVLFPYNELMIITPKAFIVYILRLKKYNEQEVLNQVFEINADLFQFDIKKLELWITLAYNTLVQGRRKEFTQRESIDSSKSDLLFSNEQLPSPISHQKTNQTKNKLYSNDVDGFINLNNYAKDYYFLKTIEYELIDVMRRINPKKASLLNSTLLLNKTTEITSEDYISRLIPQNDTKEDKATMKKVTIIKYHHHKTYSVGYSFGEIAVDSKPDQLNSYAMNRLFTAITREDCHLGYFPKKVYFDYIKPANDRGKKNKVDTLKSFGIFMKTKKHQLIKNYSSCFNQIKVFIGDEIIKDNQEFNDNQKVYFIIEGEFERIFYKSISEIDQLLTQLGHGEDIRDRIRINIKPETEQYFTNVNTRSVFCLNVYRPNDIIGLNDCFLNGKYIYSVKCKSNQGVLYEINMNLFQYIVSRDINIVKITYDLIESKKRLLVDLLLKYRDTQIEFSYLFNKHEEYNTKRHLNLQIFKKKRSLPHIPWITSNTGIKESDIDLSLKNTSHRITLGDERKKRTLIFRKKYYEKMKNIKRNKREIEKERNEFNDKHELFTNPYVPRILECKYNSSNNNNINNVQNKDATIDPLIFDNFNRMFNTSFYYQNLFQKPKRQFNFKFKFQNEKTLKKTISSCSAPSLIRNKDPNNNKKNKREASINLLNTKLNLIYNHSQKRLCKKMIN